MTIKLQAHKLYILSGPPCTGKSTLLKHLGVSPDCIVSSDAIRAQIFGARHVVVDGDVSLTIPDMDGDAIFNIIFTIVRVRMKQRLTTFIDATSCKESDRNTYANIAKQFGVDVVVLIMKTTQAEAQRRNTTRQISLQPSVIDKFFKTMNYETTHHSIDIYPNDVPTFVMEYNNIPDSAIDVVGDVHGLYDELVEFLVVSDYYIDDGIIKHPTNRKLLFIGDVIDRGPKSIETLTLIAKSVTYGGHHMIRGNHEYKIWNYYHLLALGKPPLSLSASNAGTIDGLMKLKSRDREMLLLFIKNLPFYQTIDISDTIKFVFTHADISYFTPETIMHSDAVYGCGGFGAVDSDKQYDDAYNAGLTDHMLIRGHVSPRFGNTQESVFVLEMGQAFAGKLAMLSIDEFAAEMISNPTETKQNIFTRIVKTHQCTYNYDEVRSQRTLANTLYKLVKQKLVTTATDKYGLKLFKYSKKVFYDNLWNDYDGLTKARGVVFDQKGSIVQHTFDKVFNYRENDTGVDISDDHEVIATEKLNGFFGAITRHPYANELLVTTTGSFDSDFVGYIREYITGELRGKLMKFFHETQITLMFEINHPDDPHIIAHNAADMGLWLIGAREHGDDDVAVTELIVDSYAHTLGLRRPNWNQTSMGEIKKLNKTSQIEGYMIRDAIGSQEYICKLKTPFYLTTKFLGRLKTANIYHMVNNPMSFRQRIDEEFFPIIDILVDRYTARNIVLMDDNQRTRVIREIILEHLDG